MGRWLVTRHPGAREWLCRQGVEARVVVHLDPAWIAEGDEVYGTLPIHIAAAVCARGARFFHLTLDLPPDLRGQEIDATTMDTVGARLVEYRILHADDMRHRGEIGP